MQHSIEKIFQIHGNEVEKGKPAKRCNEQHPQKCDGWCIACPTDDTRCWDKDGHMNIRFRCGMIISTVALAIT